MAATVISVVPAHAVISVVPAHAGSIVGAITAAVVVACLDARSCTCGTTCTCSPASARLCSSGSAWRACPSHIKVGARTAWGMAWKGSSLAAETGCWAAGGRAATSSCSCACSRSGSPQSGFLPVQPCGEGVGDIRGTQARRSQQWAGFRTRTSSC